MISLIDLSQQATLWLTLMIVGITVALYATERFAIEVVALGSVIALMCVFSMNSGSTIGMDDLTVGFANPALITILALLVVGQGLFFTNAIDPLAHQLARLWPNAPDAAIFFALIIAMALSAFINNTPVVVMFIPVLISVAARRRIMSSKIMIPLSYMSILGGMLTLIGSSTNLLAADIAKKNGNIDISFFTFTAPGAMMAAVGAVYVLFVLPRFLPNRKSMNRVSGQAGGRQFIAEITLEDEHPLLGEKPVAGMYRGLGGLTLRTIVRGKRHILPPFEDIALAQDDMLMVASTREQLSKALANWDSLTKSKKFSNQEAGLSSKSVSLTEALVPPGSRLIGQGIDQHAFHEQTGCMVVGVQRKSRMSRQTLMDIHLEAGDVLLLAGTYGGFKAQRASRDLVVLEWAASEIRPKAFALRAQLIFAFTISLIASSLVPMVMAALIGAMLMIVTDCLNIRQAARAFDRKIYMLVGSSIAMSTALQASGGATLIAQSFIHALGDSSPAVYLTALYVVVAFLTNVLSNNATALIFTPIAISTATALGVDPLGFVVAVILGANSSFASPIGYQTNLLVMGPGHYRFKDYALAGIPLIILLGFAFALIGPYWFGL